MRDTPILVAHESRMRLANCVRPTVEAVVAQINAPGRSLVLGDPLTVNGKTYACRLGVLVQAHPLLLRVVVRGLPKAVELERIAGDQVPGLRDAVDELLAGALAGLTESDQDLAMQAAIRGGELLVSMDLENGDVKVMVAKRGEDLSRAVVVGAIVSESATTH